MESHPGDRGAARGGRRAGRPRRGLGARGLLLQCPTMTTDTIRVGFIGAGNNTRRHHIPKLKAQPGVELVAVANRTAESSARVAREFGIGRVCRDWREVV